MSRLAVVTFTLSHERSHISRNEGIKLIWQIMWCHKTRTQSVHRIRRKRLKNFRPRYKSCRTVFFLCEITCQVYSWLPLTISDFIYETKCWWDPTAEAYNVIAQNNNKSSRAIYFSFCFPSIRFRWVGANLMGCFSSLSSLLETRPINCDHKSSKFQVHVYFQDSGAQ